MTRQIEIIDSGARRFLAVQAVAIPRASTAAIGGLIVAGDVTAIARAAAMKAEFVANASHELRTPLATIRAAVDSLVAADPQDGQTREKVLAMLDRHVQRLQDLTNDLLDLHNTERPKDRLRLEEVTSSSLANWANSLFQERAREKGLTLEVSAPTEFSFPTDRKLVELVLQNLLDNAIKFTPAGGSIRCLMSRENDRTVLSVSDTGCGIRMEDQPRVFERFFQADTSRKGDSRVRGTGLGLAIVRHAVERLGAKIDLQSELGRGTTVIVRLP